MFWGEHSVRIDEKGRFFLPARFRPLVEDGVAVLPDAKRCLTVLPVAEFERRAEELLTAKLASQASQDYSRWIGSVMVIDTPDKQGRVSLTPVLLEHAGIQRDGMVIGALSRAEIWSPAAWHAERIRVQALAEGLDSGEGTAVL